MRTASPPIHAEASPSQANYNIHTAQLEPLIVEQMSCMDCNWLFRKALDYLTGQGFSRSEAVDAINSLAAAGTISFIRHCHNHTQPYATVVLLLELVEQGGDK
jgi:hypothetical protein